MEMIVAMVMVMMPVVVVMVIVPFVPFLGSIDAKKAVAHVKNLKSPGGRLRISPGWPGHD